MLKTGFANNNAFNNYNELFPKVPV